MIVYVDGAEQVTKGHDNLEAGGCFGFYMARAPQSKDRSTALDGSFRVVFRAMDIGMLIYVDRRTNAELPLDDSVQGCNRVGTKENI